MEKPGSSLTPVHPGEVLAEEFLATLQLSNEQLAKAIGLSVQCIDELVGRKRSVTADMARRLSLNFGNSAQFWLGLQMDYDKDVDRQSSNHSFEGNP